MLGIRKRRAKPSQMRAPDLGLFNSRNPPRAGRVRNAVRKSRSTNSRGFRLGL